jgi:hypothetical protein
MAVDAASFHGFTALIDLASRRMWPARLLRLPDEVSRRSGARDVIAFSPRPARPAIFPGVFL